jgi:PAS domain-containing protein
MRGKEEQEYDLASSAPLKKGDMGMEKRGSSTELHLRTAMEQSPLGTAILGPDGRYLLVNAAWNALWALGRGGPPKDSGVFEDAWLRAMGLTPVPRRV